MIRSISIPALLLAVAATSANATQYTATSATFQSVMAKVSGGDTVKLVGSFGETKLTNKNFASLVTIDASAASFSNALVLTSVSNVNFIGGHYGSDTALSAYNKAVAVFGGTDVSFTNPNVTGFYTGQGIAFTGTTNAAVTGAVLTKLQAGIVFSGVTGGTISNSKSIGAVSDGFDIVDSSHIDIGNNSCTGGTPTVGAHPDCVQMFSSSGAAPLTQINIHNNVASGNTQGFDNFGSTAGDSYISIVNNRIAGMMPDGIDCFSCVNSTITGNTVTSLDGAPWQATLNVLYGTNNVVSGNTVGAFNRAAAKPTVYYTRAQLIGAAAVSSTGTVGAVPEPAAWTMLIAGFAMVGLGQRRSQRSVAA